MQVTHTPTLVESRIFFDPSYPLRYPQVPPLGHDPGGWMKIQSDMFHIFHLWVDTQSLVKNLWNWLCNWNLMIFNNIWLFGPSPGPQGAGPKNVPLHTPFMWATHNKFGWISSNGVGGDSMTDGGECERMDRGECFRSWAAHLISLIIVIQVKVNYSL